MVLTTIDNKGGEHIKPYIPEKLAAISRYQNYLPTLPQEIQQELYARMGELIEEEKPYCDKGRISL